LNDGAAEDYDMDTQETAADDLLFESETDSSDNNSLPSDSDEDLIPSDSDEDSIPSDNSSEFDQFERSAENTLPTARYFTTFDDDDLTIENEISINLLSAKLVLIPEPPTDHLLKMIRLLDVKVRHGISDAAIQEILGIFELSHFPSQHVATKILKELTGLEDRRIDCCIHSCIAFTDDLSEDDACPCGESRYEATTGKPRKTFQYISPIPRLLLQYVNPQQAKLFKTYPQSVIDDADLKDFWNGSVLNICGSLCLFH
jgi:hypothetical protein